MRFITRKPAPARNCKTFLRSTNF